MDNYLILIRQIRQGDEEALKKLIESFRRMIYKIIYSQNLNSGDFRFDEDDLFQEGCLALYDAVFSFEEDKNVRFTTYAYVVIRGHIRKVLRDDYHCQKEGFYSIDRSNDHDLMLCVKEDPVSYHREERMKEEIDAFFASLDPQDRDILKLKQESFSYKQIAERLHINVKRVDNRLNYLKKRLRQHLSGEEEEKKSKGF